MIKTIAYFNIKVLIGFLASSIILSGCYADTPKAEPATDATLLGKNMSQTPDTEDTPYLLKNEEKIIVITAIKELVNVISGVTPMKEQGSILGKGQYHYPKAPELPITTINFQSDSPPPPVAGFLSSLKRKDETAPWSEGGIFLRGIAYVSIKTDFKEKTFTDDLGLDFVKVHINTLQPNDFGGFIDQQSYAEYIYKLRNSKVKIEVKFFVDKRDYNPKEKFPHNFNTIEIKALDATTQFGASLNEHNEHLTAKINEKCPKTV